MTDGWEESGSSPPIVQPDNSSATRLRNLTIQVLSGYTTGQLKHCPVTQPDNSSAARLRNGTVPLRNRMALSGRVRNRTSCASVRNVYPCARRYSARVLTVWRENVAAALINPQFGVYTVMHTHSARYLASSNQCQCYNAEKVHRIQHCNREH